MPNFLSIIQSMFSKRKTKLRTFPSELWLPVWELVLAPKWSALLLGKKCLVVSGTNRRQDSTSQYSCDQLGRTLFRALGKRCTLDQKIASKLGSHGHTNWEHFMIQCMKMCTARIFLTNVDGFMTVCVWRGSYFILQSKRFELLRNFGGIPKLRISSQELSVY